MYRETNSSRVRSAAVRNQAGAAVDTVVRSGALVGNPARPIRIVTLGFLADGGDGYPFPDFEAANPALVDRVDLDAGGVPGASGFAARGTEQDALASYLSATHGESPFDDPETGPGQDRRIQDITATR